MIEPMKLSSDFLARAPFRTDGSLKSPFASLGDMLLPSKRGILTSIRPAPDMAHSASFLASYRR